jgi:hypothetical protein
MSGTEALYVTTGPECRDDCSRKRSGVGIAANLRTARRQRLPRVASVGQDPNLAAPVAHLSYPNLPDCDRTIDHPGASLVIATRRALLLGSRSLKVMPRVNALAELWNFPHQTRRKPNCDTNLKALPRSKWRSVGCQMRCMLRRTEASACQQKRLANSQGSGVA